MTIPPEYHDVFRAMVGTIARERIGEEPEHCNVSDLIAIITDNIRADARTVLAEQLPRLMGTE
jgi:hypothetical protein